MLYKWFSFLHLGVLFLYLLLSGLPFLFKGYAPTSGILYLTLASSLTYWLKTPRSTSASGVFPLSADPCVPPWTPRRSLWLKLYSFSLLMYTFPKLVTLIISLVTQAKMLTTSLVPTHCFTQFHRISGCIHSVSTYFSNLSSPLYPTVKDCQVHQCPSPYQQQAFQTSVLLGNPPLMLHPYPLRPAQRSAAAMVDSSHILPGLPTSGRKAEHASVARESPESLSASGLSLDTEACSALVWNRPQYQEINMPRTIFNQWSTGIDEQRSHFLTAVWDNSEVCFTEIQGSSRIEPQLPTGYPISQYCSY